MLTEKEVAQYGFRWGPVDVYRTIGDSKFGYFLHIETIAGVRAEIRVSPKGKRLTILLKDALIEDADGSGKMHDLTITVPDRRPKNRRKRT